MFAEGDACALADVTGWGVEPKTKRLAIVGVRDGRNLELTLKWQWPVAAQAMLFPDKDETGRSWLAVDGFAHPVRGRSEVRLARLNDRRLVHDPAVYSGSKALRRSSYGHRLTRERATVCAITCMETLTPLGFVL